MWRCARRYSLPHTKSSMSSTKSQVHRSGFWIVRMVGIEMRRYVRIWSKQKLQRCQKEIASQQCRPELHPNQIDGCCTDRSHNGLFDHWGNLQARGIFFGRHSAMPYGKTLTGVRFVPFNVVEKVLFDMLHWRVMYEFLYRHVKNYVDTCDSAEKIDEYLVSTKTFILPSTPFIQRRTGEAIAARCGAMKMEKQLNTQILDAYVKQNS